MKDKSSRERVPICLLSTLLHKLDVKFMGLLFNEYVQDKHHKSDRFKPSMPPDPEVIKKNHAQLS